MHGDAICCQGVRRFVVAAEARESSRRVAAADAYRELVDEFSEVDEELDVPGLPQPVQAARAVRHYRRRPRQVEQIDDAPAELEVMARADIGVGKVEPEA